MPKIKIISSLGPQELEDQVNTWINTNFEKIAEIYNIDVKLPVRDVSGTWTAIISYDLAHGK